MTDSDRKPLSLAASIVRFWQRVPVLLRAIVLGFVTFEIGVVAWAMILAPLVPAPWSVLAMVAVLWLYWKYFSGSWWPRTTAAVRRNRFRSTKMPATVWKWGLVAATLFVVVVQSGFVITFRLIEFPADTFTAEYNLDGLPFWSAWLLIVMSSLVAGICEETGFRGYMQVPLEKRYGPATAIAIGSTIFVVTHLHQAWALPILFHLFAMSVMLGILAYASGSLIPGMIGHTVMDLFNFSFWWSDVAGTFDNQTIAETGIDTHFVVWILILVASVAAFVLVARRTLTSRRQTEGTPRRI